MADKKIKALAAKVDVLAKSVAALATIVHSLQRSFPQAPPPPPPARWMEKAVQAKIHFAKDRQGRTMMNLQPQHMDKSREKSPNQKEAFPTIPLSPMPAVLCFH
ncbi:hypothetical protein RHSIM_Rhsim03G0114300 [Rhododendron simsii]|uniref:Uncharacterized protein n=1 Tax=Rhododendron simsii TaxID=118357 RepID=A0A834HAZ1_RHOSS|nr:hypothetical protein RHSIM_Rhsim03G0114300 [Rhododendron simsii]